MVTALNAVAIAAAVLGVLVLAAYAIGPRR